MLSLAIILVAAMFLGAVLLLLKEMGYILNDDKEEGTICEPEVSDPHGTRYEYDDDEKCILKTCAPGFKIQGNRCVADVLPGTVPGVPGARPPQVFPPTPERPLVAFPTTIAGLVGRYTAGSAEPDRWRDISSSTKTNHSLSVKGVLSSEGGYVYGGVGDSVIFPEGMTGTANAYTLFYVARYNGPVQRRIFVDASQTHGHWLSGFHEATGVTGGGGAAGCAHHNDWITHSAHTAAFQNYNHKYDWVIGVDQHKLFRSNRTDRTTAPDGGGDPLIQLGINANVHPSDWAIKEILFYDRELPISSIRRIEEYLERAHTDRLPDGISTKRGYLPGPSHIHREEGFDENRGEFRGSAERCRQIAIKEGYPMWGYRMSNAGYAEANTCFFDDEGYDEYEEVVGDWVDATNQYMGCTDHTKSPMKSCL